MASHNARDLSPSRRLRVPTALAVALVGSSASLAIAFAGCDDSRESVVDAAVSVDDASTGDTPDSIDPASLMDAGVDGKIADAPLDAAIDARPDAPPDARPDAPVV